MKDNAKEVEKILFRLHGALSDTSVLINTKFIIPESIKEKYLAILQEIYDNIKVISLQGISNQ